MPALLTRPAGGDSHLMPLLLFLLLLPPLPSDANIHGEYPINSNSNKHLGANLRIFGTSDIQVNYFTVSLGQSSTSLFKCKPRTTNGPMARKQRTHTLRCWLLECWEEDFMHTMSWRRLWHFLMQFDKVLPCAWLKMMKTMPECKLCELPYIRYVWLKSGTAVFLFVLSLLGSIVNAVEASLSKSP